MRDWEQNRRDGRKLGRLVREAHATLPKILPCITNWDVLVTLWNNFFMVNAPKLMRLVEGRMEAVVTSLKHWSVLSRMRSVTLGNSQPQRIVEERMRQVFPKTLSTVSNDIQKLAKLYHEAFDDCMLRLIRKNVSAVVLPVNEWNTLVRMHRAVDCGDFWFIVESRMTQVLPTLLPSITDWNTLTKMGGDIAHRTPPMTLINKRKAEVYEEVVETLSSDNVPVWLSELMECYSVTASWPEFLRMQPLVNKLKILGTTA